MLFAFGVQWPRISPHSWLVLLLSLTLVSLLVSGFWVKGPCVDALWDGHQYETRCYTDLIPLYGGRDLDESQFPYVESFNEYPVLTGLWMYLASLPADDSGSFFIWNAVGLGLVGLAVTFFLWRTSERSVHVLWWALAPPLVLYAFHNWDLLAVLFSVLGLYAYKRDRLLLSGGFLGLGVATKLFPVVFLPILGAELLRRAHERGDGPWWESLKARGPWRFSLGAIGAWLAVNLPFILINRSLWWETYSFHSGRGPTTGSHWNAIRFYAGRWDWDWLSSLVSTPMLPTLSPLLFVAGTLVLVALVLKGRLGALSGCLAVLCVFLLANQVFSGQYVLWLVPFFALLPEVTWWRKGFLFLTDLLVYLTVFDYFNEQSVVMFEKLALASMLRVVALVLLLLAAMKGRAAEASGDETAPTGPELVPGETT